MTRDTRPAGRIAATVTDTEQSRLHGQVMAVGLALGAAVTGLLAAALLNVVVVAAVAIAGAGDGRLVLAVMVSGEAGYLRVLGERIPVTRPTGQELLAAVVVAAALVVLGQAVLWLVPGAGIEDLTTVVSEAGCRPAVRQHTRSGEAPPPPLPLPTTGEQGRRVPTSLEELEAFSVRF